MSMSYRVEADDTGQGKVVLRLVYGEGQDEMTHEILLNADQAMALTVELNSIFSLRHRKEVEDLAAKKKGAQPARADDHFDPRDPA
jgi:hypothetical protein